MVNHHVNHHTWEGDEVVLSSIYTAIYSTAEEEGGGGGLS